MEKIVLVLAGSVWQYKDWVRKHPGVSSRMVQQEWHMYGYDPGGVLIAATEDYRRVPIEIRRLFDYRFQHTEKFDERCADDYL